MHSKRYSHLNADNILDVEKSTEQIGADTALLGEVDFKDEAKIFTTYAQGRRRAMSEFANVKDH